MTIKTQSGSNRNEAVLPALICVFAIVSPLIFYGGGIFVTDEGTYARMLRNFADSFSLSVWNGYEQFPSPELVPPHHGL